MLARGAEALGGLGAGLVASGHHHRRPRTGCDGGAEAGGGTEDQGPRTLQSEIHPRSMPQKIRTATHVDTSRPATTGKNSCLTSSSTETRQKPVIARSEDHAMSVPPPVEIAPIWPIAARVSGSMPAAGPSAPESEPVSGSPEKPEPVEAGRHADQQHAEPHHQRHVRDHVLRLRQTRSKRNPGATASSSRDHDPPGEVGVADEEEPRDRDHDAHGLEGEHEPVDDVGRAGVQESSTGPGASVATISSRAAVPPTRPAVLPPGVLSGTRSVNLPSAM